LILSSCLDHNQAAGRSRGLPNLKTPSPPSIDRAISVLELLGESRRGLTLAEVASRLDIPRSSAHTILLSLERRKWLQRNVRTRRYLFGPQVFCMARRALAGMSLREHAEPALKKLCQKTRLAVHMAILEDDQAVLVDQYAPAPVKLHTWIGKRMELHCTALGKVLLAWMPEADVQRILDSFLLPRHNENTKGTPRSVLAELRDTRARGYAIDDEEAEIGYRCLGAPVFDEAGHVAAAISVSGSTSELHFVNAAGIALQLQETAAQITERLRQERPAWAEP
jgi:DNA-binding IclR family transcriptional regulator